MDPTQDTLSEPRWVTSDVILSYDSTHLSPIVSLTLDLTGEHTLSRSDEEVIVYPKNAESGVTQLKFPTSDHVSFVYSSLSQLSLVIDVGTDFMLEMFKETLTKWERVMQVQLPFNNEKLVPHDSNRGAYGAFAIQTTLPRVAIFNASAQHIRDIKVTTPCVLQLSPLFCVVCPDDISSLQCYPTNCGDVLLPTSLPRKNCHISRDRVSPLPEEAGTYPSSLVPRKNKNEIVITIAAVTNRKFVVATATSFFLLAAQIDSTVLAVIPFSNSPFSKCTSLTSFCIATGFVEPFHCAMSELCAFAHNKVIVLGHIRKNGNVPVQRVDVAKGTEGLTMDVHHILQMPSQVLFCAISQAGEYLHVVTSAQTVRYKLSKI